MTSNATPDSETAHIKLRIARCDELALFTRMQVQAHASRFLTPMTQDQHELQYDEPAVTYLSIVIDATAPVVAGYFVLVDEGESIEFRRIVIDQSHRGIGQKAIGLMEQWCIEHFGRRRIWLDVFSDNDVGKHIYEKLGYTRFSSVTQDDRKLLFYEKQLA